MSLHFYSMKEYKEVLKEKLARFSAGSFAEYQALFENLEDAEKSLLCRDVLSLPQLSRARIEWAIDQLPYGLHDHLVKRDPKKTGPDAAPYVPGHSLSPLVAALSYQNRTAVDLLLQKGAPIDDKAWLAIQYYCPQSKLLTWVKKLLPSEGFPENAGRRILLEIMVERNHRPLVHLLLDRGLDPFEVLREKTTLKRSSRCLEVFHYLIAHLASTRPDTLERMHQLGWDPLLIVLHDSRNNSSEQVSKVNKLLAMKDLKLDLHWENAKGVSAFSYAVQMTDTTLVEKFMRKGAKWPEVNEGEDADQYFKRVSQSWHRRAFQSSPTTPFYQFTMKVFTSIQKESLNQSTPIVVEPKRRTHRL